MIYKLLRAFILFLFSYPKAITMVSSGRITPEITVSHTFELKESEKAFKCASCAESGAVKVLIHCNS